MVTLSLRVAAPADSTVTLDRGTAGGQRLRSVLRFAHTGEVLGMAGQTIAGLASLGTALLVWTGLALSWHRFWAWRRQRLEATR